MEKEKKSNIVEIKEEQESYSDESLYNITSFGTDLPLRELVTMYDDGDLEKPEMQRKYVWDKKEASRFIDSILLGLPVPSIFLARTPEKKMLIVDGYQRIMTIYDYMKGTFSKDGSVFKLTNSEVIYSSWRGKSYQELTEAQKRTIRTSPIHAIVFEQKQPQDDTGMYQIFERINTGGRILKPQEIRNCVYHGNYNNMLMMLNKNEVWRKVLGSENEDSRMADIELILRFFAFVDFEKTEYSSSKQINLVNYLNTYMKSQNDISDSEMEQKELLFIEIITYLWNAIGEHLFRTCKEKNGAVTWAKKVNPVVMDAVCTATVFVQQTKGLHNYDSELLNAAYQTLMLDEEFTKVTKQRTTNVNNIHKRVNIVLEKMYGIVK